jgi:nucleoside-diphosphate-sugar epimerase
MSANRIYNITKSHAVTLLEAAETIVRIVGRGTVEVRDKDADFPSRGALDIDRARVILGYEPKVDVEEGFQRYYEWLASSTFWAEQLSK